MYILGVVGHGARPKQGEKKMQNTNRTTTDKNMANLFDAAIDYYADKLAAVIQREMPLEVDADRVLNDVVDELRTEDNLTVHDARVLVRLALVRLASRYNRKVDLELLMPLAEYAGALAATAMRSSDYAARNRAAGI